jgi:hypothetical protein
VTTAWVILTTRYGEDISQPSADQLREAVRELRADSPNDSEHPNATLRYGTDDGPMFTIDAYRGGKIIVGKYADQDFSEPSIERKVNGVSASMLLELWVALARGDLERIRMAFPECGW